MLNIPVNFRNHVGAAWACLQSFREVSQHCLKEEDRPGLNVTLQMVDSAIDFTCHNAGDRIACKIVKNLHFSLFYIFCFQYSCPRKAWSAWLLTKKRSWRVSITPSLKYSTPTIISIRCTSMSSNKATAGQIQGFANFISWVNWIRTDQFKLEWMLLKLIETGFIFNFDSKMSCQFFCRPDISTNY